MRPTDLDIELYLVGDLDAAGAARIEDAAKASPELAAHLASRRADQAAFAISRPRIAFDGIASDDGATAPIAGWRKWAQRMWAPAGAFAMAAAVLVFVALPSPPDASTGNNGVTARGAALVAHLIAKRDAVVFQVTSTTPLRPNDQVRIEVELDEASVCSLVGFDPLGASFVLYDNEAMAAGKQVFPDSIVLDDNNPGQEHLVIGCTAEGKIAPSALTTAFKAKDFGPLNAPAHVRLSVLTYEKEAAATRTTPAK